MELKRTEILAEVFHNENVAIKLVVFDQKEDLGFLLGSYKDKHFRHVYIFTRKKIERYLRYL